MVGGERLRRDVVDVDGLDLGSGALTRPRSRLACRSLSLTPSAIGVLETGREEDDQGVVLLELVIPTMATFIRKMRTHFLPPADQTTNASVGRGENVVHSLRSAERLISTDPALRRRQVVSRDLRRCPISI